MAATCSQALMRWSLERTEEILFAPSSSSWNTRWLEVLNDADREGNSEDLGRYEHGLENVWNYLKILKQHLKAC